MTKTLKPALCFLLGGIIVSLSTCLGRRAAGSLPRSPGTFPVITV